MAACKEDTSYEERNAKLLAWLADEKQLLFDPYTVGDTLTFLTAQVIQPALRYSPSIAVPKK